MSGKEGVYFLPLSITAISVVIFSYAGIMLTCDPSKLDMGTGADPLIWELGSDYSAASFRGFASGFTASTNKTCMNVTINGLPEAEVTIDEFLQIASQTDVTSFKIEISTAMSGSLSTNDRIQTLKFRFWTGGTAPADDSVPTLHLTATPGTSTPDIGPDGSDVVKVQLVAKYRSGTLLNESAQVQIRITDIIEG